MVAHYFCQCGLQNISRLFYLQFLVAAYCKPGLYREQIDAFIEDCDPLEIQQIANSGAHSMLVNDSEMRDKCNLIMSFC